MGPAPGEDAAAVRVGEGVLVAAADPITLTGREAGRLAVLVNANDVAVMGARPRWFLATLLLPEGSVAGDVHDVFAGLTSGLAAVDATLVGGHTEVTPAVRHLVVSGQMLGTTTGARVVTTGGARPGDVVVQVGPVPVEGAAVLAAELSDRLADVAAADRAAAAGAVDDPGISVVAPALIAAELGATAMHDPTEGGLAGGLHELAEASRCAVRVDLDKVTWFPPGVAVCQAVGADPLATLASGCLLTTFPASAVEAVTERLMAAGHVAAVLGRVEEGGGVTGGDGRAIARPDRDEVARVLSLFER